MTPELQQRVDSKLPPFDGACVHSVVGLTLFQLRELLAVTAKLLVLSYPVIRSYHDWHEHDGYIVEPNPDSWDTITSAIASDRTLFESRDDDFEVRFAFFPPSFDWLLRYNIDQDDESDVSTATCDFDLSVAKNNQSGIINHLLMRYPDALAQCESHLWFISNYGG
ncbi:MAG: hypothetical protein KDB27_20105 [Planctomycetales bacterium]|nr:hypothetical protein [Planctomycetales bacterium]